MENLRSNDLFSARTQDLLNSYSSKKKEAQAKETDGAKNYDEVFARISQQTSDRINKLKSTMKPEQLAKLNLQNKYAQALIPANVETKAYTSPVDNLENGTETAEENTTAAAATTASTTASETKNQVSRYKERIEEMAVKRNVSAKFKDRDIDAEIDALIAKKLTGANGESLSIRSDLPTVIKNYEVKQGDTLAGISKNFYKDAFMFKNISTVNEVKAPYKLSEGQNLRIVFHQVQAGENDTLDSIAEKYTQNKISPKALAKLNEKSEINPGDTLLIPVQFTVNQAGTAAAAAGETDDMAETLNDAIETAEKSEPVKRFHLSRNTSEASLEETKRQIEKYASQIERLNF
jgi:nucleoid-associated protein YgaU